MRANQFRGVPKAVQTDKLIEAHPTEDAQFKAALKRLKSGTQVRFREAMQKLPVNQRLAVAASLVPGLTKSELLQIVDQTIADTNS